MISNSDIPDHYILYADDDPDDREGLVEMISEIDDKIQVFLFVHGLELFQFLEQLPPGSPYPCCIILDMNMPVWNGTKTLKEIKARSELRAVPVIIFSTSSASRDASISIELGAQEFISKPVNYRDFEHVAERFSLFCTDPPLHKVQSD